MKLKFTKTALMAIQPPAINRLNVYDTEIPKLVLRISAAGSRTFYVIKRVAGAMEWIKLGSFPEMTVEQARTNAQKVLSEFATGANPAAVRRAIREEPSFLDVFQQYLAEKKKRDGSPLSDRTKRDYTDVVNMYLAPIHGSKLSQITRSEIKTIHSRTTKKSPAQADRAIIVVSSVYNFAADLELFTGSNPASRIQKNPAPSRDRFALAPELPYLMEAIAESDLCDFFLLSLLTGARRSNVQEMAWRDLDLDAGIWRVGMTKNGTPQNVTLSPEAVATLKNRQPKKKGSSFVFPGTGKTGHLVEPKKAWATVLRRASMRRLLDLLEKEEKLNTEERQTADFELLTASAKAERKYRALADSLAIDTASYDMTDLRIHDLRRTLGSWQAKTGASLAIIGKSLNHKTHQATQIYARLDLDPVRQSVNIATQAMLEAAGLKEPAKVLDLHQNHRK